MADLTWALFPTLSSATPRLNNGEVDSEPKTDAIEKFAIEFNQVVL